MLRTYVIPFLKKKMDTSEEIAATLDDHGIAEFDSKFVPSEAIKVSNEMIKKQVLSGQIADQPDMMALQNGVKQGLGQWGMKRYIKPSDVSSKTWKEIFKDLEWQ